MKNLKQSKCLTIRELWRKKGRKGKEGKKENCIYILHYCAVDKGIPKNI